MGPILYSRLYHGLYYYTRDGLRSGVDGLNTVSDVCDDPTMETFLDYFDPIAYAPTQHAPLLTIVGTDDQYFTMPAINTTFDRVASAGSSPLFEKRMLMIANGKHGVVDSNDPLGAILTLLPAIDRWLKYSFSSGPAPPGLGSPSTGERNGCSQRASRLRWSRTIRHRAFARAARSEGRCRGCA